MFPDRLLATAGAASTAVWAQATIQRAPPGSTTCLPNEQEELQVYHGCSRPKMGVPQAIMKCRNYWNGAQQKCDRMCVFVKCHNVRQPKSGSDTNEDQVRRGIPGYIWLRSDIQRASDSPGPLRLSAATQQFRLRGPT
jgi:hypothetical protein